jgi:capsular polysaccharide biosynthesis protein
MSHGMADMPERVGQPGHAASGGRVPGQRHDEDQTVTMPRMVEQPSAGAPDDQDRVWDDDLAVPARRPGAELAAQLSVGLASVPFIRSALKRRARLWVLTALAGLALGLALHQVHPPAKQASTTVLLTQNTNQNPLDAVLTDIALLQSRTVASLAMHQVGLNESVTKFQGSYAVAQVTDRVVQITVNAPTSAEAVQRAKAIAAQYLSYRAAQLKSERLATIASLEAKVTGARQQIAAVGSQITAALAQPPSASRATLLTSLRDQQRQDSAELTTLQQAVTGYTVSSEVTVASMISGSRVLDQAIPLAPTKFRKPYLYPVGGLLFGLIIGMSIVIVNETMTDRLRRRDDVARALGARVLLTVTRIKAGRRDLAVSADPRMQQIINCLRRSVTARRASGSAATLAVVALNDPQAVAVAVSALALSWARAGQQVAIADLTEGLSVARLLGSTEPGVRLATVDGQRIALIVPERGDITPPGPVRARNGVGGQGSQGRRARATSKEIASAFESADELLTVATLDPAVGADHLASWAGEAVVVLAAGESTATKIHTSGEMIRLAGMQIAGAIILNADKKDESLGSLYLADDRIGEPAGANGRAPESALVPEAGLLVQTENAAARRSDGRPG